MRVERVADGEVALHREGHDRQNARVGSPGREARLSFHKKLGQVSHIIRRGFF